MGEESKRFNRSKGERDDSGGLQGLDECRQGRLEDRQVRRIGEGWLLEEVMPVQAVVEGCSVEEEVLEAWKVEKDVEDVGQWQAISLLQSKEGQRTKRASGRRRRVEGDSPLHRRV